SRTLILVDGKRFVPSTNNGTVDTNMIPSILLERAEVVTGGASAAYGSDAVAGVVNFILNERLTGIRASADFGTSTYGDNNTWSAKFASGTELLEGRSHFVIGADFETNDGVGTCGVRDWCFEQWGNMGRPQGAIGANYPSNSVLPDNNPANLSPYGLIIEDRGNAAALPALQGISFTANGEPRYFQYGFPRSTSNMIGGENVRTNANLYGSPIVAPNTRIAIYTRTLFDFTDSLTGRLDLSYGRVQGQGGARQLLSPSYTIYRDNPFIPSSLDPALDVRGMLDANPQVASFVFGKNFEEFGFPETRTHNAAFRVLASLEGKLGGSWTWDAYYQFGSNKSMSTTIGTGKVTPLANAMDSVRNAAGRIVCRVNDDANPNNDDPACIPLNPFGQQLEPGHREYLLGNPIQHNSITEHILAANVQGDLFSTWAGPVAAAAGLEWRSDNLQGEADPLSQQLGWYIGNASDVSGKIDVTEGYLETIVPLAKDVTLAKNLELNGAIRRTSYGRSNAGISSDADVTTWKYGLVWQPFQSLRFRATQSRDIRAPNVNELFGPVTRGFAIINDVQNNSAQVNPVSISGSNPDLVPEESDTMTVGFVIQPAVDGILGRMQLSVDYYDIDIKGAIATVGGQNIVLRCSQGATEFCALLTRDPPIPPAAVGRLVQVNDTRQNLDRFYTRGFDVEFGYRQPIGSLGNLDFRLLATRTTDYTTVDTAGSTNRAGQTGQRAGTPGGMPDFMLDGMLRWDRGPLNVSLHSRYVPSGIYIAGYIDPTDPGYSNALSTSINDNSVPSAWYADMTASYDFSPSQDGGLVVYFSSNNLGNKDPIRKGGANGTGNNVLFPPVGRTYKLGVRIKR
ncbi:MAG: TonB-dependent receptor, partial [Nevskiaceae bacterium]|nr:TonB-dependent receptor [Nevskiaceae bacterium]